MVLVIYLFISPIPPVISTLGGLALLGLNGFVIGPLVAALFVASWNLFGAKKKVRLPD